MSDPEPVPGGRCAPPGEGTPSRLGASLSLYVFAVLGMFLFVTPWTAVWEQAALALLPEAVQDWVLSGWCRGGVSGIGLVDLAVATQVGRQLRRRVLAGRRG